MVVCITTYFSTKDTPTLTVSQKTFYEALGGAWRDFCMFLHDEGYYWGMCSSSQFKCFVATSRNQSTTSTGRWRWVKREKWMWRASMRYCSSPGADHAAVPQSVCCRT